MEAPAGADSAPRPRRVLRKGPETPAWTAHLQARRERAEAQRDALHAAAVAAEAPCADDDLAALAATVKRRHVHYTHCRTNNPEHVQPHQMSRRQFWEHLEKVYAEVYPEQGSLTGSILAFGVVATERHARAAKEKLELTPFPPASMLRQHVRKTC
jgi:hypothetical protein